MDDNNLKQHPRKVGWIRILSPNPQTLVRKYANPRKTPDLSGRRRRDREEVSPHSIPDEIRRYPIKEDCVIFHTMKNRYATIGLIPSPEKDG